MQQIDAVIYSAARAEYDALSPEELRDVTHSQRHSIQQDKMHLADVVARLYDRWSRLYPGSTIAAFIRWQGYDSAQVDRAWYSYLYAGQARARLRMPSGVVALPETRLGFWNDVHGALVGGSTPAEVLLAYQGGGAEAVRALKPRRETTTMHIPTAVAEDVRDVVRGLSNSDAPSPEQNAAAVLALGSLPASVQRAGMAQQATGQDFTSALVEAAEVRRDVRAWLASQGCCICTVRPVELHHLRLPDLPDMPGLRRFKDKRYELLLPVCKRHHQFGDTAAHRMSQEDWSILHFQHPLMAFFLASRYLSEFLLTVRDVQ